MCTRNAISAYLSCDLAPPIIMYVSCTCTYVSSERAWHSLNNCSSSVLGLPWRLLFAVFAPQPWKKLPNEETYSVSLRSHASTV